MKRLVNEFDFLLSRRTTQGHTAQHACARAKAQVGIAPIAPVPKHLFHGKQFISRARVSFLLQRKVTETPFTAGNVVFHDDMSTPETLDSQHELHLGAPPVLKYCTSCRHYRDAYFACARSWVA